MAPVQQGAPKNARFGLLLYFRNITRCGRCEPNAENAAGFNSYPIDSREYALQTCTSRCVASVIHSNPRPHNRKRERQMRANNQGSPRLAEACRPKIIQGQDGTSQNCNTTKGLHYAMTHNIVNVQHDQKSIAAKTPRSGGTALNASLHIRHASEWGASTMLQRRTCQIGAD